MILRIVDGSKGWYLMLSDYTFVPKKLISGIIENVDELYCFAHDVKGLYPTAFDDPNMNELLWRIDIISQWIDLLK